MTPYFPDAKIPLEVLEEGKVSRKIRAHDGGLMIVEVFFKEGAIGYEHTHPHEQICYCVEGEFTFSIKEEKFNLKAGDSMYVAGNLPHGALCLKEGRLLDIFTPQRADFLPVKP